MWFLPGVSRVPFPSLHRQTAGTRIGFHPSSSQPNVASPIKPVNRQNKENLVYYFITCSKNYLKSVGNIKGNVTSNHKQIIFLTPSIPLRISWPELCVKTNTICMDQTRRNRSLLSIRVSQQRGIIRVDTSRV
jgi:hypothetical protein